MNLRFDLALAQGYKSPSQRARVLTEGWLGQEVYCPNCGQGTLKRVTNNQPVLDFQCGGCEENYELKSKKGNLGRTIVDGAYRAMMKRLASQEVPNLFMLSYAANLVSVQNLIVVPSQFFVPSIIERRKPLPPTARRAGWVGCNIRIGNIPQAGRVALVANGNTVPKDEVLQEWKKTLFLRDTRKLEARGWTLDVMQCVEKLGKTNFTLADVYRHEEDLRKQHPDNKHIKAKIRQQLQVLRDAGFLAFEGRGVYRLR